MLVLRSDVKKEHDDDEGQQRQKLDEGQPEKGKDANGIGGSRVSRNSFAGSCQGTALRVSAPRSRDRHRKPGSNQQPLTLFYRLGSLAPFSLCQHRGGDYQQRQTEQHRENQLSTHHWSPFQSCLNATGLSKPQSRYAVAADPCPSAGLARWDSP